MNPKRLTRILSRLGTKRGSFLVSGWMLASSFEKKGRPSSQQPLPLSKSKALPSLKEGPSTQVVGFRLPKRLSSGIFGSWIHPQRPSTKVVAF